MNKSILILLAGLLTLGVKSVAQEYEFDESSESHAPPEQKPLEKEYENLSKKKSRGSKQKKSNPIGYLMTDAGKLEMQLGASYFSFTGTGTSSNLDLSVKGTGINNPLKFYYGITSDHQIGISTSYSQTQGTASVSTFGKSNSTASGLSGLHFEYLGRNTFTKWRLYYGLDYSHSLESANTTVETSGSTTKSVSNNSSGYDSLKAKILFYNFDSSFFRYGYKFEHIFVQSGTSTTQDSNGTSKYKLSPGQSFNFGTVLEWPEWYYFTVETDFSRQYASSSTNEKTKATTSEEGLVTTTVTASFRFQVSEQVELVPSLIYSSSYRSFTSTANMFSMKNSGAQLLVRVSF